MDTHAIHLKCVILGAFDIYIFFKIVTDSNLHFSVNQNMRVFKETHVPFSKIDLYYLYFTIV